MKDQISDASWLPPREEWDFRAITTDDVRVACLWEYARSSPHICDDLGTWMDGKGEKTGLAWYIGCAGPYFPDPWLSFTDGHADNVEALDHRQWSALTIYTAQERKVLLKQELTQALKEGRDPMEVIDQFLPDEAYVVFAAFNLAGTEKIIPELEGWARREAKRFGGRPKAKAAEPPFDCLKWLAAFRLEVARKQAGIPFEAVQAALRQHQRNNPVTGAAPALPIYASHGAWSKAKRDAERLLKLLEDDPTAFEQKILF